MKRLIVLILSCIFTIQLVAQSRPAGKNRSNSYDGSPEGIGRILAKGMFIEREGYPNLQLRAGYSFWVGPYLSLKAELGKAAGISVEAGIGKKFKADILTRYMGLGFRAGNGITDISFGIKLGQVVEKVFVDISEPGKDNLFFCFYLDYSHFFENTPRLGYYLGAGLGTTDFSSPPTFEFHLGISYKILVK